jgi:hypothetical protein
MTQKLQIHNRSTFYHLPICCSFCGHEVIAHEEMESSEPTPCKHTLFVAVSDGIQYLDGRSKQQILEKGYVINDEGLLEIHSADDDEEILYPSDLTETLNFIDGIVVEAHVGAPSGMTLYVGFAPLENE